MPFLYLIDLVTSISLHVIVKCSSWVVYSSGNGLYYLYKKIRPGSQITNKSVNIDDNDYVIITRQEYNKLLKNLLHISETEIKDISETELKNTNQQ
jgi:hypothetical protein